MLAASRPPDGRGQQKGCFMPILGSSFSFGDFLVGVLYVFALIILFWLIITVFGDLIRRHDISGWIKALWVIFIIVVPYVGIFIYLITQSRGLAERHQAREQQARADLRDYVGYSPADELTKLDGLKTAGKINDDEYQKMRAKIVQ
jgi:hypothetical protein